MAVVEVKRVLVTGATGFVGRSCLALLQTRGFEVHAVTRSKTPESGSIRWHQADVREAAAMRALLFRVRLTHLLHVAWCTQPGAFWASPENLLWLHSSVDLFRAFEESGGTRIVATGSCAEYDWTSGICHEQSTPCRPTTRYGRTKLASASYLDAMRHAGLSTAWARLFFMYGPGSSEQRFPGAVISALNSNEPANCSDGTQQRDFLHIDDVARGVVSLLDSEVTGPINICSGTATPIRWMAQRVADLMGKSDLLRLGALATSVQDPALIVGDNSRLREELGWSPLIALDEGLKQTIDHWR